MPLLKDNQLVGDAWVAVGDDEDLPDGAAAIITLERWKLSLIHI